MTPSPRFLLSASYKPLYRDRVEICIRLPKANLDAVQQRVLAPFNLGFVILTKLGIREMVGRTFAHFADGPGPQLLQQYQAETRMAQKMKGARIYAAPAGTKIKSTLLRYPQQLHTDFKFLAELSNIPVSTLMFDAVLLGLGHIAVTHPEGVVLTNQIDEAALTAPTGTVIATDSQITAAFLVDAYNCAGMEGISAAFAAAGFTPEARAAALAVMMGADIDKPGDASKKIKPLQRVEDGLI